MVITVPGVDDAVAAVWAVGCDSPVSQRSIVLRCGMMSLTSGPVSMAVIRVPSRTPSMRPDIIHEHITAITTSDRSNMIFIVPNSRLNRWAAICTKYSPDTIATSAMTSSDIPVAMNRQPSASVTICCQ